MEPLALPTADRWWRAFAVSSRVAWWLLWLTYQARQTPQASGEVALETEDWQALEGFIPQTQTPPATPPTLSEAVRWLAQLGGLLGRRGDGEPGVKTLWRARINSPTRSGSHLAITSFGLTGRVKSCG